MRIFRYFLIGGIAVITTSCSTILTTEGKKVQVFNSIDDVTISCRSTGKGTFRNENAARNEAIKIGATHILVTNRYANNSLFIESYHCEETNGLPVAQLEELCNQNNAAACSDFASKNRKTLSFDQRIKYYKKSCDLGFQLGCKAIKEIDSRKKIEALQNSCINESKAKDCTDSASLLLTLGIRKDALRLAQRGCSLGDSGGCDLYKTLVEEDNEANRRQVVQQRNQMEIEQRNQERMDENNRQISEGANQMSRGLAHINDNNQSNSQNSSGRAPFCVLRSWGKQCLYYDANDCRREAKSSGGMCVPR